MYRLRGKEIKNERRKKERRKGRRKRKIELGYKTYVRACSDKMQICYKEFNQTKKPEFGLAASYSCYTSAYVRTLRFGLRGEEWQLHYTSTYVRTLASIETTSIATAFRLFQEFHIWLTVTTGFSVAGLMVCQCVYAHPCTPCKLVT